MFGSKTARRIAMLEQEVAAIRAASTEAAARIDREVEHSAGLAATLAAVGEQLRGIDQRLAAAAEGERHARERQDMLDRRTDPIERLAERTDEDRAALSELRSSIHRLERRLELGSEEAEKMAAALLERMASMKAPTGPANVDQKP